MSFSSDGDINLRIDWAKALAKKVFNGEYDRYSECVLTLQWVIANHWRIPLFSDYFKTRTLDELILENEMIRLSSRTQDDVIKDAAVDNQEEIEHLFDDLIQKQDGWVDITAKKGDITEDSFTEREKRFMETGNFEEPK